MNDIIRVFPRKTKWTPTDDLAFVGEPKEPLLIPDLPVYISVTFSWDLKKAHDLVIPWSRVSRQPVISIGGPAIGDFKGDFVSGRFIKKGVTFTSRGCNKRCPWCLVPQREGKLREINIADGYIVQDNNLLACSRGHIEKVFKMLSRQKKAAQFKGGLDIDYLEAWHIELLKQIRVNEIWVACDRQGDLKRLDKAADLLGDFPIGKKRCYVMIGFNGETLSAADRRLESVYEKGFLPFSQLYRDSSYDNKYDSQWRVLNKKWSRPAAYRGKESKLKD